MHPALLRLDRAGLLHLVCAVALTGVIVLQGGRLWAEAEEQEEEEAESSQGDKTTSEGDNVAPRHYHSDAEERTAQTGSGSVRKKGRRNAARR